MKVVVAVDWSDPSFNAIQAVFQLYKPHEVTLAHAVDLGHLESPIMAQALNVQGYDEFRKGMSEAGQQVLEQAAKLVPSSVSSVKRVCEIGRPATMVLNAVSATSADLVVVVSR
jgi:nucleotide-binding universal stress UspA family protein